MIEYVVTAFKSGPPVLANASITKPVKSGTIISAVYEITIIPRPKKKRPLSLNAYTISLFKGFFAPSRF